MVQLSLEGLLPPHGCQSEQVQTPNASATTSYETGSNHHGHTDLVDVSETAQDAGISHKIAITTELYDRLQHCYPGDPYENEVVLWEVLWLAGFEHTLNLSAPMFAFIATIPCSGGMNENTRLRYRAGDPAILEIAD